MRQAAEILKGSKWEAVVYPCAESAENRRFLKDFRAKHDEIYPPEDEPVAAVIRPIRRNLPQGITICRECKNQCIDAGTTTTLCLGCMAEKGITLDSVSDRVLVSRCARCGDQSAILWNGLSLCAACAPEPA